MQKILETTVIFLEILFCSTVSYSSNNNHAESFTGQEDGENYFHSLTIAEIENMNRPVVMSREEMFARGLINPNQEPQSVTIVDREGNEIPATAAESAPVL